MSNGEAGRSPADLLEDAAVRTAPLLHQCAGLKAALRGSALATLTLGIFPTVILNFVDGSAALGR